MPNVVWMIQPTCSWFAAVSSIATTAQDRLSRIQRHRSRRTEFAAISASSAALVRCSAELNQVEMFSSVPSRIGAGISKPGRPMP